MLPQRVSASPEGQRHCPPLQVVPEGQTFPQSPQFPGSVSTLIQTLWQRLLPNGQGGGVGVGVGPVTKAPISERKRELVMTA